MIHLPRAAALEEVHTLLATLDALPTDAPDFAAEVTRLALQALALIHEYSFTHQEVLS